MLLEMAVFFISWEPAWFLSEDGGHESGCWPLGMSSSLQSYTYKLAFTAPLSAFFFFFIK